MKDFRTVAGLVVGTAALSMLIRDERALPVTNQMLRSASVSVASVTSAPQLNENENHKPDPLMLPLSDSSVAALDEIAPSGKASRSMAGLTNETQGGTVSRRTSSFSSEFRLKLHWESGYYWQENYEETWWCMSCDGRCKKDEVLHVVSCKGNAGARFKRIDTEKGDQFRVAGTNLCLQKIRRSRRITLRKCQSKDKYQLFRGFRSGGKFDLKPVKDRNRRCLTQHHHPKAGEIVYAETCTKAHRTKTGYWAQY